MKNHKEKPKQNTEIIAIGKSTIGKGNLIRTYAEIVYSRRNNRDLITIRKLTHEQQAQIKKLLKMV